LRFRPVKRSLCLLGLSCLLAAIPAVAASDPAPAAVQADGAASQVSSLLERAKALIGRPYRYGGTTPKGFDCSGFVRFVFGSVGIDLDRSSGSQARQGEPVDLDDILPGDLLFFRTRGVRNGISHVAIYLGQGRFIHASSWRGRTVKIEQLASDYFAKRLVAVRRIIDPGAPEEPTPANEVK
jgi:cell wall-associated NlpC family hydrolase